MQLRLVGLEFLCRPNFVDSISDASIEAGARVFQMGPGVVPRLLGDQDLLPLEDDRQIGARCRKRDLSAQTLLTCAGYLNIAGRPRPLRPIPRRNQWQRKENAAGKLVGGGNHPVVEPSVRVQSGIGAVAEERR